MEVISRGRDSKPLNVFSEETEFEIQELAKERTKHKRDKKKKDKEKYKKKHHFDDDGY